MKQSLSILMLLIAATWSAHTGAETNNASAVTADVAEQSFYASFISHSFSEPTSIDSLLHDFRGELQSGDHAYTFSRAETGIQWQGFTLGYQFRYDYFLKFSEDVAQTYHASSHDQAIPAGQAQYVVIEASHIRAHGPVFGFHWQPNPTFSSSVKLTLLSADKMVEGSANGNLMLLDNDSISGDVHFLLDASQDLLLEVPVPDPRGQGIAVDLAVRWAINNALQLDFSVLDAFSRIRWQDVLFSDLYANSATVSVDADGKLHTNPVLAGYQYLYDTTQTLPTKFLGRLGYRFTERHRVYFQSFYVPDYVAQNVFGYQYDLGAGASSRRIVGGYWNQTTNAFGVELQWNAFTVSAGADAVDGRKARAWDLEFGYQLPLNW